MPTTFGQLINVFIGLLRLAIPVIASLALMVFFFGLVKFIARVSGDEKAVSEGKNLMIWGLIGIFVMVSVWGILGFFYRDIGFGNAIGLPFLDT